MEKIKFRAWLLYNKMTSFYIGKLSALSAIDYSEYESISLSSYNNTYTDWISYQYGTQTVYISQYVIFKNLNYYDALSFCEKIGTVTINGKSYAAKIMPASFWLDLPNNVLSSFYACNHLFLTSNITDDDDCSVVTRSIHTEKFSHHSYINVENKSDDMPVAFIPVLVSLNNEVNISGEDADLGDKTTSFGITYSVHDEDIDDSICITEELNGKIIREIGNASCGELYTFNITPGLFSDLPMDEVNVIKITADDGYNKAVRIYTFNRVSSNPTINYNGNPNLGSIKEIPVISYSVSDSYGEAVTITEKINDKIIYSDKLSLDTARTVSISESQWLECSGHCVLEITAENANGGLETLEITFSRDNGTRLEVMTKPSVSKTQPTKISLNVGWTTDNAVGTIYACNNALDEVVAWEDITEEIDDSDVYSFKNNTKTAEDWAVSIKIIIEKDEGSDSEVNVYSIRGTYE